MLVSIERRQTIIALSGLCAFIALIVAINPLGFFGGHWDDGRYLDSAVRWATTGPELGSTHWALRWPVVLPAAGLVWLSGLTRAALMLPSLLTFATLILFNFWAARRAFGIAGATIAAAALITTPEIALWATRLNADLIEMLFWSVALWAFYFARTAPVDQRRWLLVAGVSAGLAWATRETSIGLLLLFGIGFVIGFGVRRVQYLWILLGFVLIAIPEQMILWHVSGDIFYRLHVDMNHIQIPSNDMTGLTAPGESAPLNPEIMARWSGDGPVRLHWLINPWANLFLNFKFGFNFIIAAIAIFIWRRKTSGDEWTPVVTLSGVALANVITILYIVAADPKARMFMPATLAMCIMLGWLASRIKSSKFRYLLYILLTIKAVFTLVVIDVKPNFNRATDMAVAAAQTTVEPIHVDIWGLSHLALADPALKTRLTIDETPVGGLFMTVGIMNDEVGDDAPPPGASWKMLYRQSTGQMPNTITMLRPLANALGLMRNYRYKAVYVSLYRRLPDKDARQEQQPIDAPKHPR
jgi:4-amino-4-deoxy-L-arabinose transferase-like glycosyltransferase